MERDFRYFRDRYGDAGAREKFEKVCVELLQEMHNNAYPIKSFPGDEGIDIYVGNFDSPIEVYQCKYFLDRLEQSQKSQIRRAFKKCIKTDEYELKKWFLCLPIDLTIDEMKWWDKWKNKMEDKYSKPIKLINESKLLLLLKKNNLYKKVFDIESSYNEQLISKLKTIEHDKEVFLTLNKQMDYKELKRIIEFISKNRAFKKDMFSKLCNFVKSLENTDNEFLINEIEKEKLNLIESFKTFLDFVASNFFYYPSNQMKDQCLQPDIDPDRGNTHNDKSAAERYREYLSCLNNYCDELIKNFMQYRRVIKDKIFK